MGALAWALPLLLLGCDGDAPDNRGAAARDAATRQDSGGGDSVPEHPDQIICDPPSDLGDDDAGAADRALYHAAAEVLLTRCGQTRCHGPLPYNDLIDLSTARCDVRAALVDVPACEYPLLDRVEPGDPQRSWLMIKLTAPHDARYRLLFEPDAAFEGADDPRCADAGFGLRMPPAGFAISDDEIEVIRTWIEAGAPGPG